MFSYEAVIFGLVISLSASGNAPWDIYPILGLLVLLPTVVFFAKKVWFKGDPPKSNGDEVRNPPPHPQNGSPQVSRAVDESHSLLVLPGTSSSPDGSPQVSPAVDGESGIQSLGTSSSQCTETTNNRWGSIWNCLIELMIQICASLTAYHFCWLVTGTMINPVWGFTFLLLVLFVIVALTYTLYLGFSSVSELDKIETAVYISYIVCLFLGFCSLIVLAILAAKIFYGTATAYDVLKTVLTAVILAITTWAVKKWKEPEKTGLPFYQF